MATLSFITLKAPVGLTNGKFAPWLIQWQLPQGAPSGFVIQHTQLAFQGVRCCGDDKDMSDGDIWNLFEYDDPTRLDFWESWQYRDGVWQLPGSTDSWGFSRPGTFYSNDTEGKVVFTGSAGFYAGDELNEFGAGWGANGDNDGSPMSGDLMSTTQTPQLSETTLVNRTMSVEWHPCECDSDDAECRRTIVTVNSPDSQSA